MRCYLKVYLQLKNVGATAFDWRNLIAFKESSPKWLIIALSGMFNSAHFSKERIFCTCSFSQPAVIRISQNKNYICCSGILAMMYKFVLHTGTFRNIVITENDEFVWAKCDWRRWRTLRKLETGVVTWDCWAVGYEWVMCRWKCWFLVKLFFYAFLVFLLFDFLKY